MVIIEVAGYKAEIHQGTIMCVGSPAIQRVLRTKVRAEEILRKGYQPDLDMAMANLAVQMFKGKVLYRDRQATEPGVVY